MVLAVDDHVRAERENARGCDRQDFQRLEAQHAIVNVVQLFHLENVYKRVVYPREHGLQGVDAQQVQVVADFRLICLQQVLKQLAHADDALGVRRDRLQVAQVLAVESSENEVDLFFLIADVAERRKVAREMLHLDDSARRVHTDRFIVGAHCNERRIGLGAEVVEDLAISEEQHDA